MEGMPRPTVSAGATWDGEGERLPVLRECDVVGGVVGPDGPDASQESHRFEWRTTNQTWHAHLPEGRPGLHYGFRVNGYDPPAGHQFNPAKLLLDPMPNPSPIPFGCLIAMSATSADAERSRAMIATMQNMPPRCVVVDQTFAGGDRLLHAVVKTVIYRSAHQRGFTARHPHVPGGGVARMPGYRRRRS